MFVLMQVVRLISCIVMWYFMYIVNVGVMVVLMLIRQVSMCTNIESKIVIISVDGLTVRLVSKVRFEVVRLWSSKVLFDRMLMMHRHWDIIMAFFLVRDRYFMIDVRLHVFDFMVDHVRLDCMWLHWNVDVVRVIIFEMVVLVFVVLMRLGDWCENQWLINDVIGMMILLMRIMIIMMDVMLQDCGLRTVDTRVLFYMSPLLLHMMGSSMMAVHWVNMLIYD